ncbi:unnamed protein product [Adineta steineri]|uniref:Uncharacterized protein n=1 Tax=Adineta steineri TaxID=433720 RepID=A0A819EBH8_9BILA|nr:unnamed protein product [Adineta steineri]
MDLAKNTIYSLIDQTSDIFNNRLLVYDDKQEIFDIKEISQHFALDTVDSCLFSIETNSLQDDIVSPRLARYLYTEDYSILPKNTMDYLRDLLNQILNRCRQHLERRNDFIQIIVHHEEQVKNDEQEQEQQIRTLTKSNLLDRPCIL